MAEKHDGGNSRTQVPFFSFDHVVFGTVALVGTRMGRGQLWVSVLWRCPFNWVTTVRDVVVM